MVRCFRRLPNEVIPERGVGVYENDHTQGPACAVACGAGTIYRNYFIPLNEKIGQTTDNQVDCLSELGDFLGNENSSLWKMKNGYCYPSLDGIKKIDDRISKMNHDERDFLKGKLKVSIQWNSEVTIANPEQLVTQVYCSALPIGYVNYIPGYLWENFAKIILEALYEATFYAALKNFKNNSSKKLFLTLVGGGVFANKEEWILEAIEKSVEKFRNTPLEISIVSYRNSNPEVKRLVEKLVRNLG